MTMRVTVSVLVFVAILLEVRSRGSQSISGDELQVVNGISGFSSNFYKILSESRGNLVYSPMSAHLTLSALLQGASDSTLSALQNVLQVSSAQSASEGYSKILANIESADGITYKSGSKLCINDKYAREIKQSFLKLAHDDFKTSVEFFDFSKVDDVANNISDWVSVVTNQNIENFVLSVDEQSKILMLNSIYFEGFWNLRFNPADTAKSTFYSNGNEGKSVTMMTQGDLYAYKEDTNLDAKIIEIPYQWRKASMILIVPNKRNGLRGLEQKLATTNLNDLWKKSDSKPVLLTIPKFEIEQSLDYTDILKRMGAGIIFDPNAASFQGITQSKDPLYISRVIQKTLIKITENGVEAATTSKKTKVEAPPEEPLILTVDHPFLFLVTVQKDAKLILLQGRVQELS